MRRTVLAIVATAVITSIATSVTVGAATRPDRRTAGAPARAQARGEALPVIVDTEVDCGSPPAGKTFTSEAAMTATIRCLEREIRNVNRFMNAFFRCTRLRQVSQYGDDPLGGAFGYVWDPGDGATFRSTALDYTVDPEVDGFRWFMQWRNSGSCMS